MVLARSDLPSPKMHVSLSNKVEEPLARSPSKLRHEDVKNLRKKNDIKQKNKVSKRILLNGVGVTQVSSNRAGL